MSNYVISGANYLRLERVRQFMVDYMQDMGIDIDNNATFADIIEKEDDLLAIPTARDILQNTAREYIDNNALTLGSYEFYNNTIIQKIEMNNLQSISQYNFNGCTALQTLILNNITSLTGTNSGGKNMPSLKKVVCEKVTSIGSYYFGNSQLLYDVFFPLATICNTYSFYNTKISKIDNDNFPSLVTVGSSAFKNCTSLVEINAPKIVEIYGDGFMSCTALEKAILPLYRGRENGRFVFCNDSSLEFLYTPMLEAINESLCQGCINLEKVSFPRVNTEGYYQNGMFNGCTKLKIADLGSIPVINQNTFKDCIDLQTVILRKSSVVPLSNINSFDGTPFALSGTGGTILVPRTLIEEYKVASNWSTFCQEGTATITFRALEDSEIYSNIDWYRDELIEEGILEPEENENEE